MDLSQSAIKTRRVTPADPKVYDAGTGQFFERKTPQDLAVGTCPSVADVRRNLERLRAEIAREEADASEAPASATPMGRDTEETGRDTTIEGEKPQKSAPAAPGRAVQPPQSSEPVRGQGG
jgi:hypothetical protein